jgi:hypothetical protein
VAFVVRLENGHALCGSFANEVDEAVMRGEFRVWSPAEGDEGSEAREHAKTQAAEGVQKPQPLTQPTEDVRKQPGSPTLTAEAAAPEQPPTATYKHIEITDIRKLPKRNWHLCNNSFLVHGFFNYHYLILKTVAQAGQTTRFLGVPGIYEQQERMMALLFGFPEFEAAQPEDRNGDNGSFGYWLCPVAEL